MVHFQHYFSSVIDNNFPGSSERIFSETDRHYTIISPDTEFARNSVNPLDKRLDFTAYFLALIITLKERGESYDTIRRVCLEAVTEYVKPRNRLQVFLKRLPAKLANTWLANWVLTVINKRVSQNPHPDGFVANIITDRDKTFGLGYGFDIIECGICKLFNKHGYQEYVSILCEVDKLTSEMAGLTLVRNGTIAMGAKICDFRFIKNPSA